MTNLSQLPNPLYKVTFLIETGDYDKDLVVYTNNEELANDEGSPSAYPELIQRLLLSNEKFICALDAIDPKGHLDGTSRITDEGHIGISLSYVETCDVAEAEELDWQLG